jgi:hypothetical protein
MIERIGILLAQERVLRLLIPITGITLPVDEPSFSVEKDFAIVTRDDKSPFPRVYAIFALPDDSKEAENQCLARLDAFLDCFTYLTGQETDFAEPPVKQWVAADRIISPPFAQATVIYQVSPEIVKGPLSEAADLGRKPIKRHLQNALTFYRRSFIARTYDEILIDLIISLESMFSLEPQEIRYRLSLRAAYFLGEGNTQLRQQIYDVVYEMYGARSRIVHSGEAPDQVDFAKILILRDIVRNSITRFLESNQNKNSCLENIDAAILRAVEK